jgi:quinol-cytochrome oxidoreductase complex cytochrome b subunit
MLTVLIHLLRVIFTGSYTVPRRFNYFLGLLLLIVCLFLDFTGYVLRWDEDIRWALIAGTNLIKSMPALGNPLYQMIVGGQQISATALLRFYTWHIFGLMIIFLLLGTWHIFRVRRDGGIAVPQPGLRLNQARITRFDLVRREGMAAILATMGLLILSVVFPAHLAPAIDQNSGFSSDPRAPWFFLWIQQLLKIDGPFMMGIVIPLIVWIILLLFPFVFKGTENSELGRWFPPGSRLAQLITFGLILAIMILTILAIDSS